ncbi:VacJ family lipoprotein [Simiduia sp. 21SJ11W-1]|uniref:MlaA family lipoprotein n=1 Tax=Simiduia sp. 21SJ11W-1 TaxID=2909669 RepID=UPI0020A131E6|nr:VacJ family lipoprotein [Simiduia sp. 21SJ11W-1]UTA48986.1 VacJ family lipoprotein [Simiduia sp. 21SJ11W-1]
MKQVVHYRARIAVLVFLLLGSAALWADDKGLLPEDPSDITEATATIPEDPWEGFNRKVFTFNLVVDYYMLRPLAVGYRAVTPDPVEKGIDNAYLNLRDITNIFNDILQWKWDAAANDTARFLINSTVGLAGFVDVAGHFGLRRNDGEDFAQTLAVWGVPEGPYMVLPLLGPSTVTRTLSIPMDLDTLPIAQINDTATRNGVLGLRVVALRAKFLPLEDSITGDTYVFFRSVYLQNRKFLINDGEVEDDFGGDTGEYGDYGDDYDY